MLVGYRVRLCTLAEDSGTSVSRVAWMGVREVDSPAGLETLSVRERRRPRMPNQIGPHLEQRIVAFAPGASETPIPAEVAREKVGRPEDLRARRVARAREGRTDTVQSAWRS